jgi:integrase
MPTIQKRHNRRGPVSFIAWVRIKPFKPMSKAFSTREAAKEWAEDQARQLREDRRRAEPASGLTQLTLAELIQEYLDDPETQKLASYEGYSRLLAWWKANYGAQRVLEIGARTLRKARSDLLIGREPATVNRYLAALRSCWNWGRATETIPLRLVWPPRVMLQEPRGRVRFLSDEELEGLLKAAHSYSLTMYVAILFSIATGVRMSELRRCRWSDVELDKQQVRILLTKNGEARGGYLPSTVVPALSLLKSAQLVGMHVIADNSGQAVSKGWVEYRWKFIRRQARLQNFRWHDLRHSCASLLAQNGSNLLEIGSVLGHRSPASTKRYAHLVEQRPVTGHPKLDEKLRDYSRH